MHFGENEYSKNGRKTIIYNKNRPSVARRKREVIARKSLRVNPDITPPPDIDEKATNFDKIETLEMFAPEKKRRKTEKPVIKNDKIKEEIIVDVKNANVSRMTEAAKFRAYEIRKYKDMLAKSPIDFRSKSKKKLRKRQKKKKVSRHQDDSSDAEYQSLPETVKMSKENKEFYEERKWPDNKVPYYISDNDKYDLEDVRSRLSEVNNILRDKTCVELDEIQEAEANKYEDYLVLDDSPDYVTGRVGGKQHFGVPELLHGGQHLQHAAMVVMAMLGFYFESSRHDRDRYIRVHNRHIRPDKLHHFEKLHKDATLPLPYDFKSATHPAWQFWRHGGRTGIATVATFKHKDPDGSIMKKLGQHEQLLSDHDIIKINSVYGVKCFEKRKRKSHNSREETDEGKSGEDENRDEEDYT